MFVTAKCFEATSEAASITWPRVAKWPSGDRLELDEREADDGSNAWQLYVIAHSAQFLGGRTERYARARLRAALRPGVRNASRVPCH